MLAQQLFNGVIIGAVYALFALGFNLVFGVHKDHEPGAWRHLHVWRLHCAVCGCRSGCRCGFAFILAMLACGIIGIVARLPGVPPLAQARRDRVRGDHVQHRRQHDPHEHCPPTLRRTGVPLSRSASFRWRRYSFLGLRVGVLQFIASGLMVVMVLALGYYLYRTSFGRQVRAVSSNERAAMLLGVEPRSVYMQTLLPVGRASRGRWHA